MIFRLVRLIALVIIVLLIFAALPQNFWNWLKPYFNIDIFLNTLKLGWIKFNLFLKDTLGIDLSQIPQTIENIFGINIIEIWIKIKSFLASLFYEIYKFLSK
ncbi:MAG: hypothetical protein QXL14_00515 [Candidatus Aenigmatarchaeota archaeon]